MKSLFVLATLTAALAGCSYYNTPPVAVAPVAPVVTQPNAVVLGAPAAAPSSTTVVVPNR